MSSGQELREFYDELSEVPANLREEITRKFGRLTALKILDGNTSFQKDMARLDARQRAVYRMQGLPMREEDDARITNILGDNCQITLADDEKQEPTADKPKVEPEPKPPPAEPKHPANKTPAWVKWALGAAIAGNAIGIPAAAYFASSKDTTVIKPPDRSTIGLTIE